MQAPRVRRAGPADAEALSAVGAATFADAFGHLYPPANLAAFLAEAHGVERSRTDLARPDTAAWLAEAGGEVLGYALAGPCGLPHPDASPRDGELKRLYLRRDAQNASLGARLFDAAIAWLQHDGPRTVWIGVWSQNHGAQRFYARRGFERVGEYGFPVGSSVDREFILRRTAESFSKDLGQAAPFGQFFA